MSHNPRCINLSYTPLVAHHLNNPREAPQHLINQLTRVLPMLASIRHPTMTPEQQQNRAWANLKAIADQIYLQGWVDGGAYFQTIGPTRSYIVQVPNDPANIDNIVDLNRRPTTSGSPT